MSLRQRLLDPAFSIARSARALGIENTGAYQFLARAAERLLFRRHEDLPGRVLEAEIDGCLFTVPRNSAFVYVHRDYEPGTRKFLRNVLFRGSKMIDVGANVGFLTLPAARQVGPEGHIWAIEPAPDNLAFLRHNLRRNGLDNVTVFDCAAGAHSNDRELLLRASGTLHGFLASTKETTVAVTRVPVRPIDELISCPVDLVKIDTEGSELEVLESMERLLDESPEITLLVEWNFPALRDAGRDVSELPHRLDELGFHCRVIEERTGALRPVRSILEADRKGDLPAGWFGNLVAIRQ